MRIRIGKHFTPPGPSVLGAERLTTPLSRFVFTGHSASTAGQAVHVPRLRPALLQALRLSGGSSARHRVCISDVTKLAAALMSHDFVVAPMSRVICLLVVD